MHIHNTETQVLFEGEIEDTLNDFEFWEVN